ncbi:methionyl-tRNA formyltransferase [Synechococcus sp. PCC 7502]|uniref:methionyl-tRNA formyltransferase n=1 Tax=Synechococcus sp. PCC 7502 TaxID=1173263 RepID=UPI00029F8816|nr:methionyl-tRNA formyltransferase [Synechococcus sp. PCC 7502]AFY73296.1 methionyl-tRNA formyltransferase [Synechococcus sp. PCC 7502]
MRVVFFGTPDFAVPTLQRLLNSPDFEVIGVVTQPDAKRGRGNQTTPSPVKAIALAHNPNIPIWTPERIKKDTETLATLANSQADVFVVVAYGQILSQAILDMPKQGCINVHGSLLPKYRGAAPIQWAIANGETTVGITTMQMDAGIDTGDMLLKASLEVALEDQAESVSQKLAVLGADLLIETLQNLEQITPTPQDHSQFTYAPTISKELWQIDWSKSAIAIHNQIRGFYPNCYTTLRNQRLKIMTTQVSSMYNIPNPPGTIYYIEKNIGFTVCTGDGLLLIKEVQPAGKRSQSAKEFLNGNQWLKNGDILG